MTPQMIGSSIGAYQPPPAYAGFMGGGAPMGPGPGGSPTPGADLNGALAMLGIGGAAAGGGSGGFTRADAATMQSIQNAPNTTLGGIQRGIGYASMANSAAGYMGGGSQTLGAGLGAAGGFLSMYNGFKQGGVMGYGSALAGGLRGASGIASLMGDSGAAGALGAAAGYVAAPLAVYSAIKNWQSGKTGADTVQGAEAGAAVGTAVLPGIGTVVGAVIGGAVGAISSAFGGGTTSQEGLMARGIDTQLAKANDSQRASAINSMTAPQAFQMVNGYMNAHNNSPGHSEQIEQVFGKNGVGNMFSAMMPAINTAVSKNPALAKLNPSQMYQQVVVPWLKSKGASISASAKDVKGNPEGQNLIDAITNVIGQWQAGSITSKTQLGVGGQTMNIPQYVG